MHDKAYRKRYYEQNKDRIKAGIDAWRKRNRATVLAKKRVAYEAVQAWIREHRSAAQCVDCGWKEDPDLLQFDHLPGTDKKGNVSASGSIVTAIREASKCELVCPNCHAKRTKARGQLRQRRMPKTNDPDPVPDPDEIQLSLWTG